MRTRLPHPLCHGERFRPPISAGPEIRQRVHAHTADNASGCRVRLSVCCLGERMPVATVARNLGGGNLAAAVSAREWNDGRAISRNRAPATNPLLHADSPLKATGFRSA